MAITRVQGDIRLTQAQCIMLGLNVRGDVDVNPLETDLRNNYPVFFSEYRRRDNTIGKFWIFRELKPWLLGAIVRVSTGGTTRLRHVEQVLINLLHDWQYENLKSLAIAPIGTSEEWPAVQQMIDDYLSRLPVPVIIYEHYNRDEKASEPDLT